ncbi:hypothetical protein ARMSODRAFT_1027762 [Armillaria solidipes]|uniref:Heterokaryon incompatibility domain-containing protein n=1 Tax=Armillaria solidipes TaxID=1076256 RepID=A0A2H3AJ85_9AGAR|nr:hypothetical protein ARMSODRAFT_1027762 [Armillaria solidipes]
MQVEKLDLEVTIFSRTKTDLGEWKYGRIISSALANTPCANLGPHGVFEKLNMTLGTSYIPDFAIFSVLDSYIRDNHDFGTVYAYLRYYYDCCNFPYIEDMLCSDEKEDREMQSELLEDGMITLTDDAGGPYWVPIWGSVRMWGISHAWMDEKDHKDMWTPINGYEWPVPMPKDASLDLIRIEMLNLGAEYAWFDVLCLRQMYAVREDHREEDLRKDDLRKEEWKLDVPTIGFVYDMRYWSHRRNSRIVGYFSGLGRPLNFKLGNFESHRCWLNRAWTLQEIPPCKRYAPLMHSCHGQRSGQL